MPRKVREDRTDSCRRRYSWPCSVSFRGLPILRRISRPRDPGRGSPWIRFGGAGTSERWCFRVATATPGDFTPVETMGSPPGAWPDLPRRVRIVRSLEDRVVISFDGPLAQGRVSERLFDVDALIERSRPDVIERSSVMEGAE